MIKNSGKWGCLGGSLGYASDFSPGQDLEVRELEPRTSSALTTQSLKPTSDSVCVSLSLSLSRSLPHPYLCSVSLKNK